MSSQVPQAPQEAQSLDRQLADVEQEMEQLRELGSEQSLDLADQIAVLERRADDLRVEIFRHPTPWQTVQLARHPQRPRVSDLVPALFTEVTELHGDRLFRDDPAMLAALARFDDRPIMVIGTYKGKDTKENIAHNFGMPYPEGYRKALRAMRLAEKFALPVISIVDTPAAWPGDEAEERGQAEAIARNIQEMTRLRVPIVVVITGEGGSGGALAIGVGDVVMMLQHAIYTVIPPEGCAAILWHDASRAPEAAAALRLTAGDLRALGIIDEVLPEPLGGAHRDPDAVADTIRDALRRSLAALETETVDTLLERRYNKYRAMGQIVDSTLNGDAGGRSEPRP